MNSDLPTTSSPSGPPAPRPSVPAPAPFFDPLAEEEGGIQLRRVLAAVWRQRWPILGLAVVGTAAGIAIAEYLPQRYRAQATVWIEASTMGANRGPIQQDNLLGESNAWVDLLRSFSVLDRVVQEQRLYLEPDRDADSVLFRDFRVAERFLPGEFIMDVRDGRAYTLRTRQGIVVERGELGGAVGAEAGFRWNPPRALLAERERVEFEVRVPREVSLELARNMTTLIDRQGTFMRVELTEESPTRAAGVLNAILDRYIEIAADLKRSKLEELTEILAEQLQTASANLREAEMTLEGFKVATITLPSERATPITPGLAATRDPVFDRYFDMKIDAEQLRADAEAIGEALSGGGELLESLETIPSVQASAALKAALGELAQREVDLRVLGYRYTSDHPVVQQARDALATLREREVPRLARELQAELAARATQLDGQIGSASLSLREIPPRVIEEARLERQVAIAENLYTMLEERHEEARLAAASSLPDVRILDRAAVPQKPVEDQQPMVVLMAFAASLGLGVLGAVLRDRTDPRVRYPEQVTTELGLPILGGLPQASRKRGRIEADDLGQLVEGFRALRLGMAHAHGTGPLVATITSPGSGDGKSFVTTNLAIAFGDAAKRVLVVDGDIRRGVQHQLFDRPAAPGLTDYLNGDASLESVIQPTEYRNVDLIVAGRRLTNGPELLGAAALRETVLALRKEYDVILFDSPPLAAAVDPLVLSTVTGNMMLVLRAGTTDRPLAQAKLELAQRLPIRVLGIVFNSVPTNGVYRYYSYLPGYGLETEEQRTALAEA